jgi:hypothetical protein
MSLGSKNMRIWEKARAYFARIFIEKMLDKRKKIEEVKKKYVWVKT